MRNSLRHTALLSVLLVIALAAGGAASSASASGYKRCKQVSVNKLAGKARVSQKNTSCPFARSFVRRNQDDLCTTGETIKGWRKVFTGVYEDITLTLRKGSKRIRTNLCAS